MSRHTTYTLNLKEVRIKKGKSQLQVAKKLKIAQQTYSRYELGTTDIPVHFIPILCRYYRVSADNLLNMENGLRRIKLPGTTLLQRLLEMRHESAMTQEEIAKVLGTTQQTYNRYEHGTVAIPLSRFIELCNYYNVSADTLLALK